MRPFEFFLPTKIIFGSGRFKEIGSLAASLGRRPLVVVGRRWAKQSGTLDEALSLLRESGLNPFVFEGIEPNPRVETVDRGSLFAKENGVDLVIGLGGGSVIDAAKGIALVTVSGGSIWDYIYWGPGKFKEPKGVLPIVAIPTTAATGSEADEAAVITNWRKKEKMFVSHTSLFPKYALIDPELHLSLPERVTAEGVCDMFTQVLEPFLNSKRNSPIADGISIVLLQTIMEYGIKVIGKPDDLELRETLALCATLSMGRFHRMGRGGVFSLHYIEHVVSGWTDCSHGVGLAALLPAWIEEISPFTRERMRTLSHSLFGSDKPDDFIEKVKEWLSQIGLRVSLREIGMNKKDIEKVAEDVVRLYGWREGKLGGIVPLSKNEILRILHSSF